MGEVTLYDRARHAIGEALRVDEAKLIRDEAAKLQFMARQAKDNDLLADATELKLRAERKLGALLAEAKLAGQIREGRPSKGQNGTHGEPFSTVTLKDAGIDKKLSAKAQKLAGVPERGFEALVTSTREKILVGRAVVVNPIKDLTTQEKQLARRIREAQLAAKQKLLPDKQYGVILADPEWPFEVWSPAGRDRAADNHYPTSALSIIEARDVPSIAAEDSVCFLWVTGPHHAAGNGAMILRAWGFTPKAQVTWDKEEPGTGYWFRDQTEYLLVGTRGKVPAPAPGTQWPSLVRSRKGVHSAKPEWAYELIESYFPNLPKIELNARRRREGWDAWGFEAPEQNPADGPDVTSGLAADGEASPRGDASPSDSPPPMHVSSQGGDGAGEPELAGLEEDLVQEQGAGSPDFLDQRREGLSDYLAAVAASAPLKGQHTKGTAAPVVIAGYACDPIVPPQQIADDLGAPRGSVLTWAFRLGLTNRERQVENGRAHVGNLVPNAPAEAV